MAGRKYPRVSVIDHANDRTDNLFVPAIKIRAFFFIEIAAGHRESQPGLCFSGLGFNIIEFADEGRFIPPFPPGFGKVGTN